MGLAKPALRFLAREHRRDPFRGPVLTLGRQQIVSTPAEIREMLVSEGIRPAELPPDMDPHTGLPGWRESPFYRRYADDRAFFGLLGLREVAALDCSDYEGAEFVADLNRPVPAQLHGRFRLIVDGGTLEHVFDIRQALANIALMLAPGGRVVHISPASNYLNHGFYQLSPTLFFDYYGANGFLGLRGFIAEQARYFPEHRPWVIYRARPDAQGVSLASPTLLQVLFVAEKGEHSTAEAVPAQACYARLHAAAVPAGSEDDGGRSLRARVKRLLPERARTRVVRHLLVLDKSHPLPDWLKAALLRLVPGLDPTRRPWKLERLGKLR